MKAINSEFALFGSKNERTRAYTVPLLLPEVGKGAVSLEMVLIIVL